MSDSQPAVAEHLVTYEQEVEISRLGMWLFLATEMMLFGGIFLSITVYRLLYWDAFAEATHHLKIWIGGINTVLLLTSSLTMSLAVYWNREGRDRLTQLMLVLTAALGFIFLCVKGYEYYLEYGEGLMPGIGPPFPLPLPQQQLFMNLYYGGTGLHAMHLSIGIGIVLWLLATLRMETRHLPPRERRVECVSLYWHLIDVVWIFLYPSLYLVGR